METILIFGKSPLGVDYTLEVLPKDIVIKEKLVRGFKKIENRTELGETVDEMYAVEPRILKEEGLLCEGTPYKLEIIE